MRRAGVLVGDRDEDRRDRERDQGDLHVVDEEDRDHGDDGEDVLAEEDEAVAEEEAHRLEVHGRARHELAGLVACRSTSRTERRRCE